MAQLTRCMSHLKNTGTALEMWSTDNGGRFPKTLVQVTPDYLKTLPTCPAAGKDTYSATYQVGTGPDAYTFFCGGDHHARAGQKPDQPQYNSTQGLRYTELHPPPWAVSSVEVVKTQATQRLSWLTVRETSTCGYDDPVTRQLQFTLRASGSGWVIDKVHSADGGESTEALATAAAMFLAHRDLPRVPEPAQPTLAQMVMAVELVFEDPVLSAAVRRREGEMWAAACSDRLFSLGLGLKKYHHAQKRWPSSLGELSPKYTMTATIPVMCPVADTAYTFSADGDSLVVKCGGHHHADGGLASDYPRIIVNGREDGVIVRMGLPFYDH